MLAEEIKPVEEVNPEIPNISVDTVDGKCVIVIDMHQDNGKTYQITSLGKDAEKFLKAPKQSVFTDAAIQKELERHGVIRSFDEAVCKEAVYDAQQAEKLCSDIKQYLRKSAKTYYEKENIEDITQNNLIHWGVVKDSEGTLVPTNAFMLLTGKRFPFAKIQCALFKGTERVVFVDKREFDGPLYEQIEEAYAFVLKHINLGAKIDGLVRTDAYELPPEAIREAIVNAVTHRNFRDRACIQVAVYDDRVEVTSPGMLYGGLTIEQMKKGGSKIRNRCIAEVFSRMRIIEGWGTGIKRMISSCREYRIREPEFLEIGDSFRVNLYRPTYETQKPCGMTKRELQYMQEREIYGSSGSGNPQRGNFWEQNDDSAYGSPIYGEVYQEPKNAPQKVFERMMAGAGMVQYTMAKELRSRKMDADVHVHGGTAQNAPKRPNTQNIDLYL